MKKIVCVLLSMFLLTGCGSTLQKYSATSTNLGFDTVVSFTAYTENEATFNKYYDMLGKEFHHYDQLFDIYNSYPDINNIKTINDNAGKKPVKVDPEIMELLTLSKQYAGITNNQFDITIGNVLAIWHDYRDAGIIANEKKQESKVPSTKQLQEANKHKGWQHVHLDKKNNTVYIDDKDVSLDVGGDAKGFAVEKIAQKLQKAGLQHAIVNGGGNIRLIGDKPDKKQWSVGIQMPNLRALETDSLVSIKVDGSQSFVTSGDYQRYYLHDGKIMHHIIDPTTLQPARHCRSVTVITKDSGIADILSTTLYTISHQNGLKLLKQLKDQYNLQVDAVWVYDKDNEKPEDSTKSMSVKGYQIVYTDGLKDKISAQ